MWLLTFACFPRRGVRWLLTFASFPHRGVRWLTFARFPRRGIRSHRLRTLLLRCTSCTARAPYRLECVRERTPLRTAAADVGLLSCDLENDLYTRQPLMRGCYHVIYKMSSTHGSRWWGAVIMWIIKCPLHTAAADVGLLSCELENVLYTRQPLMRGCYHVN